MPKITELTNYTTPNLGNDVLPIVDVANNVTKKITVNNLINFVYASGQVTLNGQDGVTVEHNKGDTNYIVKVAPKGSGALGYIGDIAVLKSANTCVIYNSGIGNIAADIEISRIP